MEENKLQITEMQWIPADERLPEIHGEECLVSTDEYVTYAQWSVVDNKWYLSWFDKEVGERQKFFKEKVIAWCPLPDRYEAKDENF